MAHQIAIAKASFAASLLRPDPTSVPRSEVDYFHSLLNSVTVECSPANVQKCKRWILSYIVPSQKRCESLGKYLLALSTSFVDTPKSASQVSSNAKKEVSTKRRRLHILYLIHDLIHHTKIRGGDSRVALAFEPFISDLFAKTAEGEGTKHQKKIVRLVDIWSSRDNYPSPVINKLRDAVRLAQSPTGGDSAPAQTEGDEKAAGPQKERPYDMPSTHGDYNTAWYDLPAANLMQHIIPNSTKPIKGSIVQPLQFKAGPASKELADAVKMLILDSMRMFGEGEEEEEEKWDVDALGQRVVRDELGAKKIEETYYGWSEEFAGKMARKKKNKVPKPVGMGREDRDMERSYSSGRSMSPPRGMGYGRGRGGSGRDSRSRTRSRTRSRSRGKGGGYGGGGYGGNGNHGAGGGMGPPRGRGRSSRSATPESMIPRGLGY